MLYSLVTMKDNFIEFLFMPVAAGYKMLSEFEIADLVDDFMEILEGFINIIFEVPLKPEAIIDSELAIEVVEDQPHPFAMFREVLPYSQISQK